MMKKLNDFKQELWLNKKDTFGFNLLKVFGIIIAGFTPYLIFCFWILSIEREKVDVLKSYNIAILILAFVMVAGFVTGFFTGRFIGHFRKKYLIAKYNSAKKYHQEAEALFEEWHSDVIQIGINVHNIGEFVRGFRIDVFGTQDDKFYVDIKKVIIDNLNKNLRDAREKFKQIDYKEHFSLKIFAENEITSTDDILNRELYLTKSLSGLAGSIEGEKIKEDTLQ